MVWYSVSSGKGEGEGEDGGDGRGRDGGEAADAPGARELFALVLVDGGCQHSHRRLRLFRVRNIGTPNSYCDEILRVHRTDASRVYFLKSRVVFFSFYDHV
ncbi:hypothetical protein B296_00057148 [Ensete ventricosum]|uniref:Uncharacterized protein n=1 Tax=Ensete ventricosum TaxID=4639 RepID=A0A426X2L7_ENSVE|nr:hypothetical protein B296_00057148 [Ensete ventricosum]